MIKYHYNGINVEGKEVAGFMLAQGETELRVILRAQGIRPKRIYKAKAKNEESLIDGILKIFRKVPIEDLVIFTRQLQVLIGSGIPLVQGLDILVTQTQSATLAEVVGAIRERVSSGSYLWEALSDYPDIFPRLYIALIRAGEASGSIDQMLKRLSRYMEDAEKLRRLIKSAMMYPIIVTLIGAGVVSLMLIFVIPKFEEMLKGANQELPLPTMVVMAMSHFLTDHFMAIFGSIVFISFSLFRYTQTAEGGVLLDRLVFHAPIFGAIVQKASVARFARTMQTLLVSGVNLIDAIDICRMTMNNAVLEAAISKIRTEVEAGKTLGSVVGKIDVFPRMAVQMISVGESTGNLDKMLEKVSDFYEDEVEVLVGGLTKLIEPIVLVVLGGAVGGILIAMYLPIFKIASTV